MVVTVWWGQQGARNPLGTRAHLRAFLLTDAEHLLDLGGDTAR